MLNRRQIVSALSVIPLTVFRTTKSVLADETPRPQTATAWSGLLDAFGSNVSKRVVRIKIDIAKGRLEPRFEQAIEIEYADAAVLRLVDLSTTYPLRLVWPDGAVGFAGGGAQVGRLTLITRLSEVPIGITKAGFILGAGEIDFRNMFFSAILARLIDDILFVTRRIHLPTELLETLSGEDYVRTEHRMYSAMINETAWIK